MDRFRVFWITGPPQRRSRAVAVAACLMAAYGFVTNSLGGRAKDLAAREAFVLGILFLLVASFTGEKISSPRITGKLLRNLLTILAATLGIVSIGQGSLSIQHRLAKQSLTTISATSSPSELKRTARILNTAASSGVVVPTTDVANAYSRLSKTVELDKQFGGQTWNAGLAMLDYSSAITWSPIQWVGPTQELAGFPGLYGFTELKNAQLYGSQNRVPLEKAAMAATFRSEQAVIDLLRSGGYTTWPEFAMIAGGSETNVVLDKLHLRNVILKHIHVVYGGGPTVLENVTFQDCTFEFAKTEESVQLSNQIVQREPITLDIKTTS